MYIFYNYEFVGNYQMVMKISRKGIVRKLNCKNCGRFFWCLESQIRLRNRKNCSKKCQGKWHSKTHPNKDPHRTLYYRLHKEEYKMRNKKWIEKNKERYREWLHIKSTSPEERIAHAFRESKRRARLLGNGVDDTVDDDGLYDLLIKQNFVCNGCKRERPKYQMDHIISIARGGKHTITNIQLLCKSCNCSKNDSLNWKYAE